VIPSAFDESLIILSDVHLGNDLNDLTPGGRRSERVDTDLANLLAHYGRTPPSGRRWRLVIAGDFIDFIGMAILPDEGDLDTEPSEEERAHGLGNTVDHGRLKLRAVAARHRVVFEALASFVADGHALTIVHGNHDVEFHWDGVKEELRALLVETALRTRSGDASFASDFASRIEFAPWFYYVGGVAYVEHGHQYDTLCSTEHVMAPLSPADPRRIARSFSDVFLRWVVRPTKGVPEYGHERMGLVDYVMLGARLGFGGLVRLSARFFAALVELFRLRRAYLSSTACALREEHERRMTALADRTRIGIERLRALAALQVPPVTRSIPKILASVLLDRLALAFGAGLAIAALLVFAARHAWSWPAIASIAIVWLWVHRHFTVRRRAWFGEKLDNDETLVERAGHLARLFPAAFVVMGHTHSPAMVPVAEGAATYVNVGSWHEAEPNGTDDGEPMRAARTHLVIHPAPSGHTAYFLAWSPQGPRSFVTAAAEERQAGESESAASDPTSAVRCHPPRETGTGQPDRRARLPRARGGTRHESTRRG
jgi:UDP-2,3-diacylglucosamine pyrophosphatase LpxH